MIDTDPARIIIKINWIDRTQETLKFNNRKAALLFLDELAATTDYLYAMRNGGAVGDHDWAPESKTDGSNYTSIRVVNDADEPIITYTLL